QMLVQDKLHFEIKAPVAPRHPSAPLCPMRPDEPLTPLVVPPHCESAPVRLTAMLVSTVDPGVTAIAMIARYRRNLSRYDSEAPRFLLLRISLPVTAPSSFTGTVAPATAPLFSSRPPIQPLTPPTYPTWPYR
ncbi:hypothetical protein NX905_29640, partial [Burkholderia thailandensis]|uniref:hypothetical protein n=1 Tax=Burkholderia thailandensis TaxID=57975 RepID=UPI00217E0901